MVSVSHTLSTESWRSRYLLHHAATLLAGISAGRIKKHRHSTSGLSQLVCFIETCGTDAASIVDRNVDPGVNYSSLWGSRPRPRPMIAVVMKGRSLTVRPKPRVCVVEHHRPHRSKKSLRANPQSFCVECRILPSGLSAGHGRPHAAQSFQSRQGTVPSGTEHIIASRAAQVKRRRGDLFHKSLTAYPQTSGVEPRNRGRQRKSPACPEPSFCCPLSATERVTPIGAPGGMRCR